MTIKPNLHKDKMSKEHRFFITFNYVGRETQDLFLYIFLAYQTKQFDSIAR